MACSHGRVGMWGNDMDRRRLLRSGNDIAVNETILAQNYKPNGESFHYINNWDIDGDTLYIEWINSLRNNLANFITMSPLSTDNENYCINTISTWNNGDSRKCHVYSNAEQRYQSLFCLFNFNGYTQEKRTFCMLTNDVNKLMVNSSGLYVNGTLVADQSFTVNDNLLNGLSVEPYIALGSMEGNNRSYDHYNKISIIHKKYTAEEMATLTTV